MGRGWKWVTIEHIIYIGQVITTIKPRALASGFPMQPISLWRYWYVFIPVNKSGWAILSIVFSNCEHFRCATFPQCFIIAVNTTVQQYFYCLYGRFTLVYDLKVSTDFMYSDSSLQGDTDGWINSKIPIKGIAWARSRNAVTHGLWMWKQPFIIKRNDRSKVCFDAPTVGWLFIINWRTISRIMTWASKVSLLYEVK